MKKRSKKLLFILVNRPLQASVEAPKQLCASFVRKRERAIWQRRYWEHTIRDEQDYAAHVDYIHFNPVRHGLAARAADWAMRDVGLTETGERR